MILFHDGHKLFIRGELQEPTITVDCTTETCSSLKFLLTLCKRAVIETELFPVFDFLRSKHSNTIDLFDGVLFDLNDRLAIGIAAVTEPRSIVAIEDRVNSEDVISFGVVEMAFVDYIIKFRQLFRELILVLPLLQDILLFIPVPLVVDLTKVFNNKAVLPDALNTSIKNAQAF